jgi:hypothetical protein
MEDLSTSGTNIAAGYNPQQQQQQMEGTDEVDHASSESSSSSSSSSSGTNNSGVDSKHSNQDEETPFSCNICFDTADQPVTTMCGHLFWYVQSNNLSSFIN